jgi:hypothetical protein
MMDKLLTLGKKNLFEFLRVADSLSQRLSESPEFLADDTAKYSVRKASSPEHYRY